MPAERALQELLNLVAIYQSGIKSNSEWGDPSLLRVLKAVTPESCARNVLCDAG